MLNNRNARIYIAGHRGLVGSALVRRLKAGGYQQLLLRDRAELDLTERQAVRAFFEEARPEYVVLAAAKVGGIHANNTAPAQFIQENLLIQSNVIDSAYHYGTRKLLFLGSSCIYPRLAPQPIVEEALLTGPLESTNEWYAIAKIAGLKTCQAYRRQYGFDAISAMPTNLYGPGDNFDLKTSHVLPALMRKFHEAKIRGEPKVSVWGSGTPRREFLHVDDLADALVFLLEHYSDERPINIGTGVDLEIRELAALIGTVVGYHGEVEFDASKPDGTPRKQLDVSRMKALGWTAGTPLKAGIEATYRWYLRSQWASPS